MKQISKVLLFACCLLISFNALKGQETGKLPLISGNYILLPAEQFLLDLQKQTGYRFYFDTTHLDSLRVNGSFRDQPLNAVLDQVFEGTGIGHAISIGSKRVFISKGLQVKTSLPDDFFGVQGQAPKDVAATEQTLTDYVDGNQKTPAATLENKLYVIGDKLAAGSGGNVTIAGYLHDIKTGEPVIGASIYIDKPRINAITDQFGYYSLIVPKGRHTLNIQSLNMKDTRRQVMIYQDGKLNIDLYSQVTALKHVVVSSEKTNAVRNMQMGVQKIDIKAIKQVPVVFGEADVLRVVLTLPGVKSVGEASTGLNVRGGSADQNLILFNDATIFNPAHFFGMFSAFNPEVVKDVQLYKSGIPAKYGGRLSSVLEINSREGNKKNFTGSAGIGLLTSRVNIEGPIVKDKTSFIFGGRTTYANWLLNLLPEEYKHSKASFYDLNLNITHEINKKNSLYLTTYMSRDRFNLNNDTSYNYSNRNVSLKWKHTFNNKWFMILAGGYDFYEYGIGSTRNKINAYKMGFDLSQSYFKAHVNYFANAKQTIEFGVNAVRYELHPGSFKPDGAQSLVAPVIMPSEQALESAVYLSDKYAFSPEFSVEAGLRYSVYTFLGPQSVNNYLPGVPKTESTLTGTTLYDKGKGIKTYHGGEVRLSARYAFNNVMSIKAGYNSQRQYVHMLSNTAAMAPTDIWKLSDPNIRPQYGDQFSVGLYRNFKSNTIETSVEVYYKRIKDYLDYKSGAQLVLNPHIETDVMNTEGKAYGVELMIKKTAGKFNGWFSYTWSRTLLQMNDPAVGTPINNGKWYPANYDKPHDLTFVGNYRISHRFSISLNTSYSTGRPITLPIARFYYAGSERTLYSDRNMYRIPDYFRTDFSMNIEGNHKVHQLTHNSWTIGVYNLTGRKNPYSVYYVSENGVVNGYKLSIFGNAIPYVNFNIRF
ncbi:TonB-dependent receptor [Sediminibacterium ginsengisoli]|uniref:Outer membrane receptor proteins, mostly Fe transport n=1 Tax=Sediminibacterium ginsengisoli TaxID=413434 RepID=A0A1T4RCK8_9BACT|nr:carboxypeptidase-like regulatory domain-containing protein [Sediminibacterium ginsengisoli]SKA13556.1 Outer membrane receptor proteins, mostly Fe transport [Sediminibacterium ginsengisoli]